MNLEFSKKASIWAATAVLVLVVGGYFGIYSGLDYMESATTKVAENKEVYHLQQDRLEKVSAFQSKIDQAMETINLMNEALPTEEHSASSISVIDALASRSGTKLVSYNRSTDNVLAQDYDYELGPDSLEPGLAADQPSITREELDISLSGNYPGISRLVSSLANSRRPFSVNSIELNESGANLNLVGYYLSN